MGIIVGISGKARVGKDTLGDYLAYRIDDITDGNVICNRVAYADYLKKRIMADFDLSYEQLYGDLKEIPDGRYFKEDGSYWTPREIMQHYGQFFRTIDYNFWVKKLFENMGMYDNIIISDLRHKNEVDAVKERGGYHIRVVRNIDNKIHGKDHISETALSDDYKVDFLVNNGSDTIEDLYNKADIIIEEILKNKNDDWHVKMPMALK
jgi:hypothetical protein